MHLFSEMCPKILEKPKRVFFLSLEMLKNFPYELMVTNSSLCATLVCESFHWNAVLSNCQGNLYLRDSVMLDTKGREGFLFPKMQKGVLGSPGAFCEPMGE